MLEIIVPDYKEKYYLKYNSKTTVRKIKRIIADNLGLKSLNGIIVINIENLTVLDDGLLIGEATESDNTRLLLIAN